MPPAYYTDLFSPETYQAFSRSPRQISGFRSNQRAMAEKVAPGDKFVCYMTRISRWIGVLEVEGKCFVDSDPLFLPEDDPFTVRFRVRPIVWLEPDKAIPIHDPSIWDHLSFTRETRPGYFGWTGILRRSLNRLKDEDGRLLEGLLLSQAAGGTVFPIDEDEARRMTVRRIRREDKTVAVTVPTKSAGGDAEAPAEADAIRESAAIQAQLAAVGEQMGFRVWSPKNDRPAVLRGWSPGDGILIDMLPLNYDDITLQTIENIDVLWLKKRSIVRAFEVEHTTAVYSGLLRMADLLALQPNMDIKLHIVAPESRRGKVFTEIRRPVFSLLERAPLSDCCTFISYDSLGQIVQLRHLNHLSDSVLDEYAEQAED